MKINYIIATCNNKGKRNHKHPAPEDILKTHLKKILEYDNELSQITIMKAKSDNYYKNYYDLDDIISKSNIPIKIIDCENYGYSAGQWFKAFEIFNNQFDYYLFIEDDYCPGINNFDKILIDCYHRKFNKIGLLCSLVLGSHNYKNKGHPIHFEGCVFLNTHTLQKLYNFPKWQSNPRLWLDKLDHSYAPSFSNSYKNNNLGGYYQLSFSHLFTLSNIEIKDYLDISYNNNLFNHPYWHDCNNSVGGIIRLFTSGANLKTSFTKDDIFHSLIIPIQLSNDTFINSNIS